MQKFVSHIIFGRLRKQLSLRYSLEEYRVNLRGSLPQKRRQHRLFNRWFWLLYFSYFKNLNIDRINVNNSFQFKIFNSVYIFIYFIRLHMQLFIVGLCFFTHSHLKISKLYLTYIFLYVKTSSFLDHIKLSGWYTL